VSAKIIQFVPGRRGRRPDETAIASRSLSPVDDLAMDHVDTAPCEYAPPEQRCDDTTPA
jgi:hypothetical protein